MPLEVSLYTVQAREKLKVYAQGVVTLCSLQLQPLPRLVNGRFSTGQSQDLKIIVHIKVKAQNHPLIILIKQDVVKC